MVIYATHGVARGMVKDSSRSFVLPTSREEALWPNSSGMLMRARMHAYECHASALPTCMRPKKLSARLPHVHVRDVER